MIIDIIKNYLIYNKDYKFISSYSIYGLFSIPRWKLKSYKLLFKKFYFYYIIFSTS